MVGPEGVVYAVEFSHRSGRDLTNMAKRRPNAPGQLGESIGGIRAFASLLVVSTLSNLYRSHTLNLARGFGWKVTIRLRTPGWKLPGM